MYKVFIDGSAGTTGLKIVERLSGRQDITLITLPENLRKDYDARKECLNSCDVAFLCLPDTASIEAVSMIENPLVKVIDTSTAHRTKDDWAYGFSELKGFKEKIEKSNKIANPGCHASGVISLIKPLIDNSLINKDICLSCFSLTGYTGGGKKMIAEYEGDKPFLYNAPRQYALGQAHKHLPEIEKVCSLSTSPCFCPIVSDFDCGMQVTIPIFRKDLTCKVETLKECYKDYYKGGLVYYSEETENGFISALSFSGKDSLAVSVFGNEDRILLVSRFDNLGKGASGAAIQNMNIALGIEETTGLVL